MALSLGTVSFDCADALKVGQFWSEALGLPLDEGASPQFASIGRESAEIHPTFFFMQVPEGKTVKNRVHLDLTASDEPAELARLYELGAQKVAEKNEWGWQWTVWQDVEGNEFCVSRLHDAT